MFCHVRELVKPMIYMVPQVHKRHWQPTKIGHVTHSVVAVKTGRSTVSNCEVRAIEHWYRSYEHMRPIQYLPRFNRLCLRCMGRDTSGVQVARGESQLYVGQSGEHIASPVIERLGPT